MTPLTVDASRLRARLDSLRTLAESTDGLAIVDSNDLAARHEARGRRSQLVLSARLLLEHASWTGSSTRSRSV